MRRLSSFCDRLQGRFNINNLIHENRPATVELDRFQRLLKIVGLDPRLAMAVVDWIDADAVVAGEGGAEAATYASRTPPCRPADRPMISVSELRLVAGFDAEAVTRLLPLVTALPERTPLNVNTAPPELLLALAEGLTREQVAQLDDKRRRDGGFVNIAIFLAEAAIREKGIPTEGLAVASRYFLVESQVALGRGRMRLFSLLARKEGHVVVVRRGQGAL
ncbi:MAG: type II secretion system minor pseudopilin GspK [Magnetococcales bacterium]|nr:type II secretion system minor pseudopilin GspK [Magnetococcales bacterium]